MKKLTIILITFFALFLVSCEDDDNSIAFYKCSWKNVTTVSGNCSTTNNVLTYKSGDTTVTIKNKDKGELFIATTTTDKDSDGTSEDIFYGTVTVSDGGKKWEFKETTDDANTSNTHTIQYL